MERLGETRTGRTVIRPTRHQTAFGTSDPPPSGNHPDPLHEQHGSVLQNASALSPPQARAAVASPADSVPSP